MSIRRPSIAGTFYPQDPTELRQNIEALLDLAPSHTPTITQPKAIIVPHAGYQYSGHTAAYGYKTLLPFSDSITKVVLIGPTHRVAVSGIAVPTHTQFASPMGTIPIDTQNIQTLAQHPLAVVSDKVHRDEHSLEIHLPFLQCILPCFSLVPIAVGKISPTTLSEVFNQLRTDDHTLFVVSTDLSHFHSVDDAQAMDSQAIEWICHGNTKQLTHQHACGATAVKGFLHYANNRNWQPPTLLHHSHSGEYSGDIQRVVGYASWVVLENREQASVHPNLHHQNTITVPKIEKSIGEQLISLARSSIEAALSNQTFSPDIEGLDPRLLRDGACFVTLNTHRNNAKALRGCIGTLTAHQLLYLDCIINARKAALNDSRFNPVTLEEWPGITLNMSILSAPEPLDVASREALEEYLQWEKCGVILIKGHHHATFLPSVWDQIPNPTEFVSRLLHKARLAMNQWPEDLKVYTYITENYAEQTIEAKSSNH